MENGTRLHPLEIKSGQTLIKNAFKRLTKWLSLADQDAENASICYGRNES